MRLIAWLSVDADGAVFLFREYPHREDNQWMGIPIGCIGGPEDMDDVPEEFRGRTWEDEPLRVQIDILGFDIKTPNK